MQHSERTLAMRPHIWRPLTDVLETEQSLIVRVEIAGMKEDDFSIELNGRVLSIYGIRQDTEDRRAYHQMEIRFGEFRIEIELPHPVDATRVEAVYSNGFLRVDLPKAKPHHVVPANTKAE